MAAKSSVTSGHFRLWSLAYRILDMEGHTDMTQGHLTIRDPAGRGFWIKRTGIAFSEVRGSKDFVLVDLSGKRMAGIGGVHGEWPIHAEIFRAVPMSIRSATRIRSTLASFRLAASRCVALRMKARVSPGRCRDIPTPQT